MYGTWLVVAGISLFWATVCSAQSTGPNPVNRESRTVPASAVFVSVGPATRHEPEYWSPSKTTIGVGFMRHLNRRVAGQFEFTKVLGLTLDTVSVDSVRLDCSSGRCLAGPVTRISGRDGTSSLWSVTGSAVLYFSDSSVQPFVSVGIGLIRQEGVWFWTGDAVRPAQEQEFQKTSLTYPIGTGVRIALPRGIFVAPEVRFQDASFKMNGAPAAGGNGTQWEWGRGVLRASVAAGYRW